MNTSMVSAKASIQPLAQWAMVVMCFALPVSRSLFVSSALLMLIGVLFSGDWLGKWRVLKQRPAGLIWMALIGWIFLSYFWSEGSSSRIQTAANVQWKLLIIPAMMLLMTSQQWLQRCWHSFAAGMTVLLLHVYGVTFFNIPWASEQNPAGVFFNPLPQSIGLAIFSAWCLNQLFDRQQSKLSRSVISLLLFASAFAVLQLSPQRLGYVSLFLGWAVILMARVPRKNTFWALMALCVVIFSVVFSSSKIQQRLEQAKLDVSNYEYSTNYTSIGARLHMWYTSSKAIQEAPLAGYGLGSYPLVIEKYFNDPEMCVRGCPHPHNQYIFYAFEYGGVGVLLFLSAITFAALKLKDLNSSASMPWAVLLVFMISGLAETTLWYRGFVYLFLPLLGLVFAHRSLGASDAEGGVTHG